MARVETNATETEVDWHTVASVETNATLETEGETETRPSSFSFSRGRPGGEYTAKRKD